MKLMRLMELQNSKSPKLQNFKKELKKKYIYRFNPHTLSYEKVEATLRDRLKGVSTTVLMGIVLGVIFTIVAFNVIDSPKEKQLKSDLVLYRRAFSSLNQSVTRCNKALAELEERDSSVYRTIFGAAPISESKRIPEQYDYSKLEGRSCSNLIISTKLRVDTLEQRLKVQKSSLEQIKKMAGSKEQRMASMPAIMPIKKDQCRIVSGFGMRYHPILHYRRMHTGIDLTAASGTPIYATGNGVVKVAGRGAGGSGYGNCVVINHGYGFQTLYGHMAEVKVRQGQRVKRGEQIGTVGRSGLSSGYHLHYEVIQNDNKVNPIYFLFNDLTPAEYDEFIDAANVENQCLS